MRPRGAIPPMVVPTTGRTGGVDGDALRALTERFVDAGVHGLFPNGTTGEFASLATDQRRTVVEEVVAASGEAPVLAGCGGTSLRAVVADAEHAADAGADAAVVVTPYYLPTDQAGLREYFATVADRSPLPVVLYDIPGLTGRALSVETVVDLAAHGNVVGVKDSSGDLPRFGKLLERTPDGFAVLQGHTAAAVAALDLGADGVVAGEANVRPGALAAVYDAHERGDRDRAADLHRERVAPVTHAVTDGPVLPSLKFLAGRAHGVDVGPPLLPLPELDDDRRAELAGVLD